jgi:uncharacterized Zn finger protein
MNESERGDISRICPWCERTTNSRMRIVKMPHGDIRERRCVECGKVLAAYLADEGDFLHKIRVYPNSDD